jgi:hypothetical protein
MSLEATGTLYEFTKGKLVLYIPADVRKDSAFPFDVGEKVKVRIDGKKLVVEKE